MRFRCGGESKKDSKPMMIGCVGTYPNLVEPLRVIAKMNSERGTHARMVSPASAVGILSVPSNASSVFPHFGGDMRSRVQKAFPTSVVRAYGAPGERVGDEIVYEMRGNTVVFPTAGNGGKGIIVTAEGLTQDDFIMDGRLLLINTSAPHVKVTAADFPGESGRYALNPETLTPSGEKLPAEKGWWAGNDGSEVFLSRNGGSFVGREVRAFEMTLPSSEFNVTSLYMNHPPWNDGHIIVEFPESDLKALRTQKDGFHMIEPDKPQRGFDQAWS